MKTTVLIVLAVFMVVAATKTNAQVSGTKSNPKASPANTETPRKQGAYVTATSSSSINSKSQLKGVEGKIFIGDNWPSGKVVLRNGGVIDTYFLRYNLLSDQMQFISGKDTLAFASPEELNTVAFDGHTFIYENYQCDKTIRQGYFEVVVPGKNKLLLKRLVTYEIPDAQNPDAGSSTKYMVDECYFISKPGQPANKMICNRKSALAELNDHSEEMEEYLRITGNKVRNPEDLKKMVIYYNSLDE